METSFGGVSSSKRFKIPPLAKGNGVHVIMDMAISNEKEFNKQMKIIQVMYTARPSNNMCFGKFHKKF